MTAQRVRLIVVALLLGHAVLLAYGARVHSPTMNEPGHLAAGLSYWQLGRFDLYRVNPPLVRLIAALPVIAVGCEIDWHRFVDGVGARPEYAVGEDLIAANGERSFWLMTLARWACIPFSLLGGWICFRWARELYGVGSGFLALALWCSCPNILAHGQLITPDTAATALGLAACYTYWHWLKRPTWNQVLISGVILGFAELTKTTLVVLFPLWLLLWGIYRWPDRSAMCSRDWLRESGMLATRTLIAVWLVNLAYLYEDSFTRLGQFQFSSHTLSGVPLGEQVPTSGGNRFADTLLADVLLPFPKNYVLGIDVQKCDFENYGQPSYLRGEWSNDGWWYYYLYALAVKVPLGTWGLFLLALFTCRRNWDRRRDETVLLLPAVAILALVSSQTGLNQHMRYVLPIFPLVFIWASRVLRNSQVLPASPAIAGQLAGFAALLPVTTPTAPNAWQIFLRPSGWLNGLACLLLAGSITSSLWAYPHSLAYFHEVAGGLESGHQHLLGSNLDWGQDLLYLKRWIGEHPEARPLKLAYFGSFDPKHAGIEYVAPESLAGHRIPPGWYAISVNFVNGFPYHIYGEDGSRRWLEKDALAAFNIHSPITQVGRTIYIYKIEGELQ